MIRQMNATVILAHPYEKSYSHAIFRRVISVLKANRIRIYSHDLYRERFDPLLTRNELGKKPAKDPLVKRYTKELVKSHLLVFIHPNWWGQPPAVMKGYIDRVIRPPHAYEFDPGDSGGGIPKGRLTGKTGLVFNTSNTKEKRERKFFKDPLESIWGKCVFAFCGIKKYKRKMFRIVSDSTPAVRKKWLKEVERMTRQSLSSSGFSRSEKAS